MPPVFNGLGFLGLGVMTVVAVATLVISMFGNHQERMAHNPYGFGRPSSPPQRRRMPGVRERRRAANRVPPRNEEPEPVNHIPPEEPAAAVYHPQDLLLEDDISPRHEEPEPVNYIPPKNEELLPVNHISPRNEELVPVDHISPRDEELVPVDNISPRPEELESVNYIPPSNEELEPVNHISPKSEELEPVNHIPLENNELKPINCDRSSPFFALNERMEQVNIGEESICAICLENCSESDTVVLKCQDSFHRGCINEWRGLGQVRCPSCEEHIM